MSRLYMLEGAKSIGAIAVVSAVAGASAGIWNGMKRKETSPLHQFMLFAACPIIVAVLLFVVVLLQYRSPLYSHAIIEQIIAHNIQVGHPMEVDYGWFGVKVSVIRPK